MQKQAILEIPLSVAINALTFAARNVTNLLARTLEVPPVKIKVFKPDKGKEELSLVEPVHPYRMQEVYEIWKLYLNRIPNEQNEAYIVISANYTTNGYGKGTWDNIQYNGFYTTAAEAENEIYGYIKQ